MKEEMLNVAQIRNELGCSEASFIELVQKRGLPAKKENGQWAISKRELDKWRGFKEKQEVDAEKKAKRSTRKTK